MLDNEQDIAILREKNGEDITEWCTKRWMQEWIGNSLDHGKSIFCYKREDCDDISVATIDVFPKA